MEKTGKADKAVRTVALMTLFTLLAKALGLLRSVLIASRFGTGADASAFSAASRVPLSFFDLLFSAAILGCFIPLFNSIKGKDAEKEAESFANRFLAAVTLLTTLLAAAGMLFSPRLMALIAPELKGATYEKAVLLLRVLFPLVPFAAATYTLVGVMQSKGRYLLPASVSLFSNGLVVLYLLFFHRLFGERGIEGLAVFTLLSWAAQFLTLFLPLKAGGFKFRLFPDLRDPRLLTALKMTPPILLGSWLLPAGWLIATRFNGEEDVAVFEYANTAYLLIAGILTYSICNYVFPKLSRAEGGKDLSDSLDRSLSSAFLLIAPFLAALPVLGRELVAVLYLRDAFSPQAAAKTAESLGVLCAALPAFSVNEILSRGFYSRKKTFFPALASALGICSNFLICLLFSPSAGLKGVAAGAACGQIVSALTLLTASLASKNLTPRVFLYSLPALAGGGAAYLTMASLRALFGGDAFEKGIWQNLLTSLAVLAAGGAVYAAFAFSPRICKRLLKK